MTEEAKKARKHEPKFNWNSMTEGLENNVTFNAYLLDLLLDDNGTLLKMYKRIRVNGKRLDPTGSGAMRRITKCIRDAGGNDISSEAVRGKIRRIINQFRKVSKYQFETGRGVDEDGLSVEAQMERDCPRFKELSEVLGDKCNPSPRSYQTGQSSKDLLCSSQPLGTTTSNPSGGTDASPVPACSVSPVISADQPKSCTTRGKGKLISEVVLGDIPERSSVAIVAEKYLGSSLSIQKKEAKARLLVEHIERHAKEIGEDPAETDKKVRDVVDDIF
ncbi:hypothetical protein MUCCIDRAFT_156604, partial [Mucor lusitanicus CBS 277.49]